MAILKNTTISDTGFLQLPAGTTAQRPGAAAGQMRYNTTTGQAEFYNAGVAAWVGTPATGVVATGGTVYDVDVEGTTYRVHVFTTTGNSSFTVSKGGSVEYLIVAGGGAGGANHAGGGGAGGVLTGRSSVTPQAYTITVGTGGAPLASSTTATSAGLTGGNSSALGFTSIGGGIGGNRNDVAPTSPGQPGGSGGGGGGAQAAYAANYAAGSGTPGQGNVGGTAINIYGGGGGGAGEAGKPGTGINSDSGNGGIGIVLAISGTTTFYGGGGGGGYNRALGENNGRGGSGGGGQGGIPAGDPGTTGAANTGGGGGGGGAGGQPGSAGGSGIVIIRYPLRQANPVVAAGRVVGDGLVLDLDFAKPTVYTGSGTVVNDSRLNGVTGTLVNGPVFTDARTHRSNFQFNGNSYIEGSNNINIGENITITGWFNSQHTENINNTVFSIGTFADISHWIFLPRTGLGSYGRISYLYRASNANGRGISSNSSNLLTGNWNWYAFVIQTSGLKCFINGSLETTALTSQSNYVFTNKIFQVGADASGTQILNGKIAYTRVYNTALTDQQVLEIFEATRWRFGV